MTEQKHDDACGASRSDAVLGATHEARLLKFMQERRAGLPAVHGELGVWKAAWYSAIDEVIAEWEKPWAQAEGKPFIDRLRAMKAPNVKTQGQADGEAG